MKKLKLFFLALVLVLSALLVYNYPRLNIITGFAAKSVCTCTFEAGRDQQSIESGDNDIDPVYYAKNRIDKEEKSVTSTVFGLKKRKAVYREGIGCVLVTEGIHQPKSSTNKPNRKYTVNGSPYPYGNGYGYW